MSKIAVCFAIIVAINKCPFPAALPTLLEPVPIAAAGTLHLHIPCSIAHFSITRSYLRTIHALDAWGLAASWFGGNLSCPPRNAFIPRHILQRETCTCQHKSCKPSEQRFMPRSSMCDNSLRPRIRQALHCADTSIHNDVHPSWKPSITYHLGNARPRTP